MLSKWDSYYMRIAEEVSRASKDPSTKVGAVLVREDNTILSTGYNGFPRGFNDDPRFYEDREFKYDHTIHAEMNAILFAKESIVGSTLYVFPFMPCSVCALHIAQAGVKRIVTNKTPKEKKDRWKKSFDRSRRIFEILGVELIEQN